MKHLGFVLFLLGLTVASWFASKVVEPPRDPDSTEEPEADPIGTVKLWGADAGLPFVGGLVLMIVGGIVARRSHKPATKVAEKASSGPYRAGDDDDGKAVLAVLEDIATTLDELDPGALPGDAQKLADAIDALLSDRVPDILDRREMLIESLGLEAFAEMIGHFATMERGAARAWSAITDEAWDEVTPSLERAKRGIERAQTVAKEAFASQAA